MKVNLTKEQIDFLSYLCGCVEDDYENYSPKEQKEREEMAYAIMSALDNAEDMEIDEDYLDELVSNEWPDGEEWFCTYDADEARRDLRNAYKMGYKQRASEE